MARKSTIGLNIYVATRAEGGELLFSKIEGARGKVLMDEEPSPLYWSGGEAKEKAREHSFEIPANSGTTLRLEDFTPDSMRLIDDFGRYKIENYLRWFSVFGSSHYIVNNSPPQAPFKLLLQGTDDRNPSEVEFGFPWPRSDRVEMSELKKRDERRPFNFFVRRFTAAGRNISGGIISISQLVSRENAAESSETNASVPEETQKGYITRKNAMVYGCVRTIFQSRCTANG
jgi:hypothetical protein